MKRLSLWLMIFLCSINVFGQTKRYKDLLATGKAYEKQKNYVYALGYYYDAMDEDPENSTEAYEAFQEIFGMFAEGKPGLGKYDSFALHDEWRNILIKAEKYWTEFPPIGIEIKEVTQDEIDYKTRTADYKVEYKYYLTSKFYQMWYVITKGCEKAYSSKWTDFPVITSDIDRLGSSDAGSVWPLSSIFTSKDGTTSQIYKNYGVALLVSNLEEGTRYSTTFVTKSFRTYSWSTPISFTTTDLRFSVFNNAGKELVTGKRRLVNHSHTYYLTGVSQNVINLIEQKKAYIDLSAFYIQYGYLNRDLLIDSEYEEQRPIVSNLPDIGISLRRIEREYKSNAVTKVRKLVEAKTQAVNKINEMLKAEEYDNITAQIEKFKADGIDINLASFGYTEKELARKSILSKMLKCYKQGDYDTVENLMEYADTKDIGLKTEDIGVSKLDFDSRRKKAKEEVRLAHEKVYMDELNARRKDFDQRLFVKIPEKNILVSKYETASNGRPLTVSWYEAIELCNRLSTLNGYEKAYIINGKKIIWNKEANGYRLLTEEEWEYAAKAGTKDKYSGGNKIDNVAWYKKNSNGMVNNVAQKGANKLGLYDMTGNLREWCWDEKTDLGENFRTVKGGSFKSDPKHCQIELSEGESADLELEDVGMRICRNITENDSNVIGIFDPWELMMADIPNKNFAIGKTEVTQKLYEEIMKTNPAPKDRKDPSNPVVSISWMDAVKFCNALSKAAGVDEVYLIVGEEVFWNKKAKGYRLPTNDEWYYAAKGGQNFKFAGSDNLDEVAWYKDNSSEKIQKTGTKKPNGYGLYDCTGNAWELTWEENEERRYSYRGGDFTAEQDYIGFEVGRYYWVEDVKYNRYSNIGLRICKDR